MSTVKKRYIRLPFRNSHNRAVCTAPRKPALVRDGVSCVFKCGVTGTAITGRVCSTGPARNWPRKHGATHLGPQNRHRATKDVTGGDLMRINECVLCSDCVMG